MALHNHPIGGLDEFGVNRDAALDVPEAPSTPTREIDAEPPDPDDVQRLVTRALEHAVDHYEDTLEPDQVEATDYYYGRPFGNEKEGRSQVVSTDVRDVTQSQMPSLMRIFFGPERAVEFQPFGPEDQGFAEQVTDYINKIVIQGDNPGFRIAHDVFKDALVRRVGAIKWWWDDSFEALGAEATGLTVEQIGTLRQDPRVNAVEVVAEYQRALDDPTMLFDVEVIYGQPAGRARIAAVPPEELVWTPNARSVDEAPFIAHVRDVPASDLVAMGIDRDLVMEHVSEKEETETTDLKFVRQHHRGTGSGIDEHDDVDVSQQPVRYAEAWGRVDTDGDGVAELRLFRCIGRDYEIVNGEFGEIRDEIPLALFTPDPEPHTIVGLSNFDYVQDVQKIKSQIERATLDSLAQSIDNVTEVVQGEVNMTDLLNPEVNKFVRVRRPGMMREVKHSFVGGDTLPVLAYYNEVRDSRTGQMKGALGIDADALQSSTKAAVSATLNKAQQRIEMIARVFAETGWTRLMKGLLRLVVRHQDFQRTVRLRGNWMQVDPRHWDADMDVVVNVALGQGTPEDRLQRANLLLEYQMRAAELGLPFVSNVELRATLARITEMMGWRNSETFWKPWGAQEEAQFRQAQAQQPPPPDPEMELVKLEAAKAQIQARLDEAKLENQRLEALLKDDRERDKVARETELKQAEIEARFAADVRKADIEEDRARMDADLRRDEARARRRTRPGGDA